jgi:inosine-uridine nucleoside N-ribohydrolase
MSRGQPADPLRVLIDADTANEIDDLYAIVRALLEPGFDVVGLSSAQWNHRLSPPDTVRQSQRLNEDLLTLLGRRDVPHPLGSEMIMGKPWGGDEPQDSPAARLMITRARQMPPGRKLVIASLGAVTNVASAVKLAPDIVPRIACTSCRAATTPVGACGTRTSSTSATTSTRQTSCSTRLGSSCT